MSGQHLSQDRQIAHAAGQRKIRHYCSCVRMFSGNAAWWSHRNANPTHTMISRTAFVAAEQAKPDATSAAPADWERMPPSGRLIYWHLALPDGTRITVSKADDGWKWSHTEPKQGTSLWSLKIQAGGFAGAVSARRDAERYAATLGGNA